MFAKSVGSTVAVCAMVALFCLTTTAPASAESAQPRLSAAPAVTDNQCNTLLPFNDVCVIKTDGQVFGAITGVDIFDLTQVVYQCDGLGHNCGIIIASHANPTSSKPVSFGHTYKNCAGFTDIAGNRWVNVCSPFVTGN